MFKLTLIVIISILTVSVLSLVILKNKFKNREIEKHNKEVERVKVLKSEGKKRLVIAKQKVANYLNDSSVSFDIKEDKPYEIINDIDEQTYTVYYEGKIYRVELKGNEIINFVEYPSD